MISIVFSGGPRAGDWVELEREMTVGRAGCDVTVEDPEVSRRHLVLRPAGAYLQVEDLGSSNGTFVDGNRIAGTMNLGDGAVIQLGDSELTVQVTMTPEQEQAPATQIRGAVPEPEPVPGPAPPPEPAAPAAPLPEPAAPAAPPTPVTPPAAAAVTGGLPRWFWTVTALVEIALILTAATLLVYYAFR